MKKQNYTYLADMSLVFVAIVWGAGFIGTQYALDANGSTLLILAMRFVMAGVILGIIFRKRIMKTSRKDIFYGAIAGLILFLGFYTQTVGQSLTVISNAAFITATNVVMVPFIVWIFTKVKPPTKTFILSFVALLGIGILSISFDSKGLVLGLGDMLVLLSAVLWASHIAYLGIMVKDRDPSVMAFAQLMTAGIISLVLLLILEPESITSMDYSKGLLPIIYLGLFSTLMCFLIQTTAQKYTSPSKAGIIMSMEGLFGSIFSVMLGLELLTKNLIIGGALVLASVVLVEAKWHRKKNDVIEVQGVD
ncbi:MAG: DMT family transporter [Vallitaleaceae bacterium]|jgi:drug/metabolite transporter (DMT)-like permease|nr:DMT family transporter [Vallitaleaceae bacterium]